MRGTVTEIPACAGMTTRGAGMTTRSEGMTTRGVGMTTRGAGMTKKVVIPASSKRGSSYS